MSICKKTSTFNLFKKQLFGAVFLVLNDRFNQIKDLKGLVEHGTDENMSKGFERLKDILEKEQKSIIKDVIQKTDGHLDTKHLTK